MGVVNRSQSAEILGEKKMENTATQISGYQKTIFEAHASNGHLITHDIYRRGSGAPVVLLQELPGIGQETLSLADELVNAALRLSCHTCSDLWVKHQSVATLLESCASERSFD